MNSIMFRNNICN